MTQVAIIETPKRRITPTQKQVAALEALSTDALISRALEALRALNRRAKEKRDRANEYRRSRFAVYVRDEINEIYGLKTAFLNALVVAGLTKVESWSVEREPSEWYCDYCEKHWYGRGNDECFGCGGSGEPMNGGPETWVIVDCRGFRFHQPPSEVTAAMLAAATPVEPHDPTQPQREIPDVGLTVAAQVACVQMAAARLAQPRDAEEPRLKVLSLEQPECAND